MDESGARGPGARGEEDVNGSERESLWFVVDEEEAGERVDRFLAARMEDVSRSRIQEWIGEGRVRVGDRAVKANHRLKAGEDVTVDLPEPEPANLVPEPMDLDIYYEDDDVIVVNKPRGLVVHPAPGHDSGTLVNGLLAHCGRLAEAGGDRRPGVVHRIDKDTSGLLVVAKTDAAYLGLAKQFHDHTVTREYLAVVHGVLSHDSGTIDAPVGRHPRLRQQMAVVRGGRPAVTHFAVVERLNRATLVRLRLETGRTHQIRVHMEFIGFPVVGDPKYGPRRALGMKGQALHAATLGFRHPVRGEWLEFTAPLPEDMRQLIERLRA